MTINDKIYLLLKMILVKNKLKKNRFKDDDEMLAEVFTFRTHKRKRRLKDRYIK